MIHLTSKWLLCMPLVWLALGCGQTEPRSIPAAKFDHDLSGYIDEFLLETASRNAHLIDYEQLRIIEFGELDVTLAGLCLYFGKNKVWPWRASGGSAVRSLYKTVTINTTYRDESGPKVKFTLFHELGHCLLNLGHSSSENSIMFPSIPSSDEKIYTMWSAAVDDFFSSAKDL